jgi:ankyrin repeat protein
MNEAGATPFWRAAYASDLDAMRLLIARGADPNIPTMRLPQKKNEAHDPGQRAWIEGYKPPTPPVPVGGPDVTPLQAAAGLGYVDGAGNSHRLAATGMMAAVKYLVEELHADVNVADADGNTALHHAAGRGDNEMIEYLLAKGASPFAVNHNGLTTVDIANGPVQKVQPFPATIALLEKLGVKNNHLCVSC